MATKRREIYASNYGRNSSDDVLKDSLGKAPDSSKHRRNRVSSVSRRLDEERVSEARAAYRSGANYGRHAVLPSCASTRVRAYIYIYIYKRSSLKSVCFASKRVLTGVGRASERALKSAARSASKAAEAHRSVNQERRRGVRWKAESVFYDTSASNAPWLSGRWGEKREKRQSASVRLDESERVCVCM